MLFQCLFSIFKATVDKSIPYIIIGIVSVFAAFLATLLPETAHEELPDTLEDGQSFGKDQSFWLVPCLKKDKTTQWKNALIVHIFTIYIDHNAIGTDPLLPTTLLSKL